VFFADSDFHIYLELLRKYFIRYRLVMPGYSLMPNHTHQVLIPTLSNSLAKGVGRLHNDFSRWQQIKRDLTGHLWQNRFFSTPTDEDHFWMALRYIELNPVRAGLVRNAWDWPWSSARAHVTGIDDTGLLSLDFWSARFDCDSWKRYLEEGLDSSGEVERIRSATRTGRPLGTENFVARLEALTGRVLRPRKRGPKPGKENKR
jgi:putative transposase